MSLEPTPLDPDDDHFRQLEGRIFFKTLLRNDEEKLGKVKLRKCFWRGFAMPVSAEIVSQAR